MFNSKATLLSGHFLIEEGVVFWEGDY